MIANLPSNFANAVAPFVPLGRQAVSQELEDLRASPFKPLEQAGESARRQNRRPPGDNPNQESEAGRLAQGRGSSTGGMRREESEPDRGGPTSIVGSPDQVPADLAPGTQAGSSQGASGADQASAGASLPQERSDVGAQGGREQRVRREVERQRERQQQQQIRQLAARDREVRQHEQAHMVAGGRFAGTPGFEFVRGPDGVNYAVAGEVQIDTSPVPGDPEATAQKAQQIRRAANAPLEPSAADRRVAAEAARTQAEAQQEIRQEAAGERRETRGASESDPAGRGDGPERAIGSQSVEGSPPAAGPEDPDLAGAFSRPPLEAGGNNASDPRLDELTSPGALSDTRPPTGSVEAFRRLLEGGLLGSSNAPGRLLDQRV